MKTGLCNADSNWNKIQKTVFLFQKNMKLKCNQYLTPVALYGFGRNGDPRPALFRGRLLFQPLFRRPVGGTPLRFRDGGISPEKRFCFARFVTMHVICRSVLLYV